MGVRYTLVGYRLRDEAEIVHVWDRRVAELLAERDDDEPDT